MSQTSTMIAHVDCNLVPREQLATAVLPPAQGPRHKPVAHIEVVESIEQALDDMGWKINRERIAMGGSNVGTNGIKYENTSMYGVLDIEPFEKDDEDGEFGTSLGIKSNNMMKHSIKLIGGLNVFVCDNGVFSAEEIVGRKLHTKNLNLLESLNEMFDAWLNSQRSLVQTVEVLRNEIVTQEMGKSILFDLFNDNVLPLKCLRDVSSTLYSPDDAWTDVTDNVSNLWGMHNAVTRVLRPMDLHKQMEYSAATTEALAAVAGA